MWRIRGGLLCNTVFSQKGMLQERKQTWAAVSGIRVLTPLQHSALARTLQRAQNKHGQLCQGADSSATQCTHNTIALQGSARHGQLCQGSGADFSVAQRYPTARDLCSAKQVWAAVPEDQAVDSSDTVQGNSTEAQNRHGQLLWDQRCYDKSATQCTEETFWESANMDSCAGGSEC
jgi:hypothetical protein